MKKEKTKTTPFSSANRFNSTYIDPSQKKSSAAQALEKLGIPIQENRPDRLSDYRKGKRTFSVLPKKGEAMDTCATFSNDYVCCNVKVLKSVSNCPYDCSYCFLQNYLNDAGSSVVGDTDALIAEVNEKIDKEPWRFFRIGTWELGDSLALESVSHQARDLVLAFSKLKNAVLELKTKSDCVESLLGLDHQKKTVVSWSLNTDTIISQQEHRTASLEARLKAIDAVAKAGYLLGFHFDPMILHSDWEKKYSTLITRLFRIVKPDQVAWISIGSLRFNPEMKKKMETHFPASAISAEEMILGPDGKMRYTKPIRLAMYKLLYSQLQQAIGLEQLSPTGSITKQKPLVYFCMERWDVWNKIFGEHPESVAHLDYLFAKNIHERFPEITKQKPILTNYKDAEKNT